MPHLHNYEIPNSFFSSPSSCECHSTWFFADLLSNLQLLVLYHFCAQSNRNILTVHIQSAFFHSSFLKTWLKSLSNQKRISKNDVNSIRILLLLWIVNFYRLERCVCSFWSELCEHEQTRQMNDESCFFYYLIYEVHLWNLIKNRHGI